MTDGAIESIGKIKRLTQLNVQGSQISVEGVRRLQTSLPGCRVFGGDYSSRRNQVRAIVQVKGHVTVSIAGRATREIGDTSFNDLPKEFATQKIDLRNVRPLPPEFLLLKDASELILADSAISTHSIRQLPTLFPVLTILDLSGTGVADRDLEIFANMQSLQRINLTRTNVTVAGIARFKQANPNCEIKWSE